MEDAGNAAAESLGRAERRAGSLVEGLTRGGGGLSAPGRPGPRVGGHLGPLQKDGLGGGGGGAQRMLGSHLFL